MHPYSLQKYFLGLFCFVLFCTQEQESMFRSLLQSFMLWLEHSQRQSSILSSPISCLQLECIYSEREDFFPQPPTFFFFFHLLVCFQCDGARIEDPSAPGVNECLWDEHLSNQPNDKALCWIPGTRGAFQTSSAVVLQSRGSGPTMGSFSAYCQCEGEASALPAHC